MNTEHSQQEVEKLARRVRVKVATARGLQSTFDELPPDLKQGWMESARFFLEEQDAAKDLLVQAVAEQSKFAKQWMERAERAEKSLVAYSEELAKERESLKAVNEVLSKSEAQAQKAEAKLSRSEASSAQVLEDLRKVVETPYRVKHGRTLTWEPGWVWEAMAFLTDALSEERLRKGTEPKPEGIEGTLIHAGTMEEDLHGLLIRVPTDVLRDAKTLPLYRRVRVVVAE